MIASDLPSPTRARNMRLIGHSDQGSRPDGVQIMVEKRYAYVGHFFSKGLSFMGPAWSGREERRGRD
jgi:hypothetical protein